MSRPDLPDRGLLSVVGAEPASLDRAAWSRRMGLDPAGVTDLPADALTWSWNLDPLSVDGCFIVSRGAREGDRDLQDRDVPAVLAEPERLLGVSSPFAAVAPARDGIRIVTDRLGFRQLFSRRAPGFAAVATSARSLAALGPGQQLDEEAVALATRLGWQLGSRTLLRDVTVLAGAGTLGAGGFRPVLAGEEEPPAPTAVPERTAAVLLRDIMDSYLDQHPDAELQLTGGLDSRIILAAIPESRRRGLRAMTLQTPGSEDAAIAARLSATFGLEHRVKSFAGMDRLDPAEAYALCLASARRLDGAADPIARAAVDFAEGELDESPRIEGLGGEVARGFYYFGRVVGAEVSDPRIKTLANWRLFANEAVPAEMLTPEFRVWSEDSALAQVADALRAESTSDWAAAVDGFYLHQRMRRWAGTLASASCLERPKFNPMLDPRFLGLVGQLHPRQKQNAGFLARIVCELDPGLAAVPLDGRPAPAVLARGSLAGRATTAAAKLPKILGKARQLVLRAARPPEGGDTLAALVTAHLRSSPDELSALAGHDFISQEWLGRFASGEAGVPPVSACALLVSLLALRPAAPNGAQHS